MRITYPQVNVHTQPEMILLVGALLILDLIWKLK